MCGICGVINFNNKHVHQEIIITMMRKMKHRGPDDEGIYINSNIGLGFVRLSILDLSPLGHQPMFDSSKRYLIIHNGEVYNYIEIRKELLRKGYNFLSNTDTEVILNSYIEWGTEALDKFNGMWAFAIYDREKKELFCSRDRYGIKPFYYYLDKMQFIFASEIPPILEVLGSKTTPNNQSIFDYLVFNRTDQTESTFFQGIKKLQHGHLLKLDLNHLTMQPNIRRWYDLKSIVQETQPFQDAIEYRDTFSSAVGLRLRSDVPVGVCLSGGLDSSSIVSTLIKDYNKNDLNTFSAIYGIGKRGDESGFINEYKSQLQNMFFTKPDSKTFFDDHLNFILAHGEPLPTTAPYAQYKVMQLAQQNVVVTLDGQGADEQLGGYHYFFGYFYKDLLSQFRLLKLLFEIIAYLKLHKSLYGLQTFLYFLLPSKFKTSVRVGEKGYLKEEFITGYSDNNSVSSYLYNSESLNKSLLDHFEYKLEHLLKWSDRNSMHFSIESRVPFLDYRLVEKTLALSSEHIIKNGWTKHILRKAMTGILPENIRLRKDKIGFATPEDEWFREPYFKELITSLLSSVSFKNRGIIDCKEAQKLYQMHLNKEVQASKEIWKIVHLELWFREFID